MLKRLAIILIAACFLTAPPCYSKPTKAATAPLVLYPPDPCYLPVASGESRVLVDAGVNIDAAQRAGMKLVVNGLSIPVSTGEFTEASITVPTGITTETPIKVSLVDATGATIASDEAAVHVIDPEEAVVRIGPDGFLRVAGKPEFPIGLYSSAHDEELAQAGFNTTHNYNISSGDATNAINRTDPQLERLLDAAHAAGLRMMVELPRKAIEKAEWAQVKRRIETFRYHPGLLCWGSEERVARGAAPPANIAALYALVHQLDPNHPLVLGDSRIPVKNLQTNRQDFFPDASMDAGIWWWYPFPVKPKKSNALQGDEGQGELLEPPSWLTTTHSKKPLWIAVQSYQKPARDARFPTPAEYRCETWLSIIYGVKGLFFYTGSGQKDYLGKPSGILNKREEGHWDYVKELAGQLRDFSPVIMAPQAAGKIELTPPNPMIDFTTRELDGKLYLIAGSRSKYPQKARWQGDILRGRKVTVLFENHAASLAGDTLSDSFTGFDGRVYRLE